MATKTREKKASADKANALQKPLAKPSLTFWVSSRNPTSCRR
jgi:hypothetical protein